MPVVPTTSNLDMAVRRWVARGSEIRFDDQVIPHYSEKTPSRRGLYATVLGFDESQEGLNINDQSPRNGFLRSAQTVVSTWSIQWFRKGARDAARCFKAWAHSPAGVEFADSQGLTLYTTGSIRRFDEVIRKEWEERAGLDATIGFIATVLPPTCLLYTYPSPRDS